MDQTLSAELPEAQLRLGPFLVDPGGRLSPAPDAASRFLVRWRDRTVRAELRRPAGEASGGHLVLESLVGKVPSSAGPTPNQGPRATLFSTLRAVPPLLPPAWRLSLSADHHIGLSAREVIPVPVSAVALLTGLSVFLLTLGPYLDLLEQHGAAPPSRVLPADPPPATPPA